jgi:UDP:flavonoid glycosyltransferase YjiC (YdhE family)
VTTGGQIDVNTEDLPPNLFVEKFLNGEKIMELADLVIHHGGTGTAYQAIRTLTPTIVIATHPEQQFIGESTQDTGMGVWMPMNEVLKNPAITRTATEKLLQEAPQRRAKIQRLRAELDCLDPTATACDWIEHWMGLR